MTLHADCHANKQTESDHLVAAKSGDDRAFEELIAPLQRELHLHCYRMLGSLADADDALQETLLRAWRQLDRFEPRLAPRLALSDRHQCLPDDAVTARAPR